MDKQYDVAVIGGGPGGYVAAIRAAQYGLKTALIEQRDMGGTCLNRGCIPTKSLLQSAEIYDHAKRSAEFGIEIQGIGYDFAKIIQRKTEVTHKLRSGVEYLVKNAGVDILRGKGVLKDNNTIEVTAESNIQVIADNIIVATGSMPLLPPIPGIDGSKVMDSDGVLSMTTCPDKIVIIGGGVIGVEFASIFNMLGKEVVIIEMMDTILPGIDKEISGILRKNLEKKGITIFTSAKVTNIQSGQNAVCAFEQDGAGNTVEGDIVVAAIGRKPCTQDLGLEKIGVETHKGFIKVNDKMETNVGGVYAIGDATGKVMLAHVASSQGLVAVENIAGKDKTMSYAAVPGCIYTQPEIACVGMTEEEAQGRGLKIKVGRFPVQANGKSLIMGEGEGIAKIISNETTGEILGAHMIAPRATDMIGEVCAAMRLESTIEEIADTIHPHPTVSEMIMEAAHDVEGLCVHKP